MWRCQYWGFIREILMIYYSYFSLLTTVQSRHLRAPCRPAELEQAGVVKARFIVLLAVVQLITELQVPFSLVISTTFIA